MKLSQVAVQLYTVREFTKDAATFAATLKKLRSFGYTAVQISGAPPLPETEVAAICRGEGMTICATHEPGVKILNDPGAVIERLQKIGCRYTAYPSPAGIDLSHAEQVETLARQLEIAGAHLRAAGITLGYHNHGFEFVKFRVGATVLDYIFSQTNPRHLTSELDTFWVHYGGYEVLAWLRKLRGRIPFIHIKDYGINAKNAHEYREIGSGSLPFRDIIAEADAGGCEWFIVEQDDTPGNPFVSLQQSFNYIKEHLVN